MSYLSDDLFSRVKSSFIFPTSLSFDHRRMKADGKNLRKLCSEFESIFLSSLIRQMRSSFPTLDLLGDGMEAEFVRWLWEQVLAQKLAEGGGIGLGKMLYEELKKTTLEGKI